MAVALLTFTSASAQIHRKGGDGEMELVSIHEHGKGIDQCQSSLFRPEINQNCEDFHSELGRVFEIILLKCHGTLAASQSQKKNSMALRSSAHDVDFAFIRNDHSESLVPVLTCGDGGHRCPYFPCPYCHRSRSIFVPKNKHNVRSQNFNCKSDDHALMRSCEEDEEICQEKVHLSNRANDQSVPVLTCGDGGHRCPYFPCPYCHRSRSITGTESEYNVDSPNLDGKSDRSAVMRGEGDKKIQVNLRSNANVAESHLISRIDYQSVVPVLTYPDGHRCPYFPCPTCHRTR